MTGYQCGCFRAKTGLSQTNRLKTCRYSLSHFFLAKIPFRTYHHQSIFSGTQYIFQQKFFPFIAMGDELLPLDRKSVV